MSSLVFPSLECEGVGDDLDRFVVAVTTIAQSQCERTTDYTDIETLVCDLPIDHLTFAALKVYHTYSSRKINPVG